MRQILELETDSLLQLPRSTGEGVDILAGRTQLARGEIVTIEDRTSIRVNELVARKS
jgi:flagellar motor switch/type III secretory pathway protein FliN